MQQITDIFKIQDLKKRIFFVLGVTAQAEAKKKAKKAKTDKK